MLIFHVIRTLLVGGIAGWIANMLTNNDSSNVFVNIGLGLLGSVLGDLILAIFGLGSWNMLGDIIVSIIGACVAIWIYHRFIEDTPQAKE